MTDDTTMPCPFCGSTDIQHNDGIAVQDYSCSVCNCVGPDGMQDQRAAIELWNTRATTWVPVSERLPEDGDGSGMHDEITLGDIDGNRIMIPVAVFLVERSAAPEEWDQYTHWFSMGEVPE